MTQTENRKHISSGLVGLLNADFCPSANRYVYWLKEPVGWFVIGLVASGLVGAFLSPTGWAIAAGILAVLILGLGFPWIATRCIGFEISCDDTAIHESETAHLTLRVTNRLPIPVMGLIIEDYFGTRLSATNNLQTSGSTQQEHCGLARVPAFAKASYKLPITPEYRGLYPAKPPVMACAFPFGIYTARAVVAKVCPVTVRPLLIPLASELEPSGSQLAESGSGNRPMEHGEFVGVRGFRRGDSLRSIHWAQSARLDEIIVCERGGPQESPLRIELSTAPSTGLDWEIRENLAWRVRIAASLINLFASRHTPFELFIDAIQQGLPDGNKGCLSAWDLLTAIPLDPSPLSNHKPATAEAGLPLTDAHRCARPLANSRAYGIRISATDANGLTLTGRYVGLQLNLGQGVRSSVHQLAQQDGTQKRSSDHQNSVRIDLDNPIDQQLVQLLQEASRASTAA